MLSAVEIYCHSYKAIIVTLQCGKQGAWAVMSCPYMGLYISMTNTSGPAINTDAQRREELQTSKLCRKF